MRAEEALGRETPKGPNKGIYPQGSIGVLGFIRFLSSTLLPFLFSDPLIKTE